jgi:hypothetical protein
MGFVRHVVSSELRKNACSPGEEKEMKCSGVKQWFGAGPGTACEKERGIGERRSLFPLRVAYKCADCGLSTYYQPEQ